MSRRSDIHKILILGSGPIVIGQAAEFDYSGVQACKVLREESYEIVLVNSNPATIMTDPELADATYVEPLLPGPVAQVIARERPDALLPTLGGQTALNLAKALHDDGTLAKYEVELIGANYEAIACAEDRELFGAAMARAGLKMPAGAIATTVEQAIDALPALGLPCIVRPAYTLGGRGGGIARTLEEFRTIVARGLEASPIGQVLLDQSVLGWGEFELEVMRDRADNVVIVCSIENVDPMGVHTGDSVTVAPQQTLTDHLYQRLRDQAIAVIRAVGVETGGSNVQFAVNPQTEEILVIEMNPRVSRSSALASKATGFPIAKIAARLAVGYRLEEIDNDITGITPACFEPTIDYVVVKWPRFAFEKFPGSELDSDHAHEVRRRVDGDRAHVRPGVRQGAALARAGQAAVPGLSGRRGPAGRPADPRPRPLRGDPRAAAPRRIRGVDPRAHLDRPVVPARALRAGDRARGGVRGRALVSLGGHVRRRVPGAHPLLLLRLGASARRRRPRPARGRAGRAPVGRDPRRRAQPDRAGHRVRLLLRARRDDRARVRPGRGHDQLQPRDGLDRLRHVRPALLRAADAWRTCSV